MPISFRITFFTAGILALIIGFAMCVPAFLDYVDLDPNYKGFLISAAVCIFSGGLLFQAHRGSVAKLTVREGFFLTSFSWIFISLLGAFPFVMTGSHLTFTDAFFESVSGITTTGATVMSDLDHLSRGILLWRSILQWLGGIGIIAFAIILLPFLKIGGMQLFRTESSDKSEKLLPKDNKVIFSIINTYLILTFICMVLYYFEGMSGFDAINHAMTTLSTGGFSTHDKSFGFFEGPLLQLTCAFFMMLGGIPFILYVKMVSKGSFDFFKDDQVKLYLTIIGAVTAVLVLNMVTNSDMKIGESIVAALFSVISVITTTGYATVDYTKWGSFAVAVFFFLTYLGGCAGSTSGGAKTMRLIIGYQVFKCQIRKLIYPNAVYTMKYQGKRLDAATVQSTLVFGALYVLMNVLLIFGLSFDGLDLETAFSGAATAIANVGPGIGHIIGPAGNFASLPDSAKWMIDGGMILGRLEIMTVLVLFAPAYWKA